MTVLPIKRVVIVVAMQEEAEPFIKKHDLKQKTPSPFLAGMPMICYCGVVSKIEIFLIWTGRDERYKVNNVATTAASVATYAAICAFKPELVLSAGTAGGFGAIGASVGDVFLSTKCVYHNRLIPAGTHFEEYGFGHFRSPSLPLLAARCGLKMGVVSTSDSLDCTAQDLELMRSEGASVKEMEAAAVAWVCQQANVPFVAIKSITDIVDGPETVESEFYANLKTASEALQDKLSLILEMLSTQPLAHWSTMSGSTVVQPAAVVDKAPQKATTTGSTNKSTTGGVGDEGLQLLPTVAIAVAALSIGYLLASRK